MTDEEVTRMARKIAARRIWGRAKLDESVIAALCEALLTRLPIPEEEALQRARASCAAIRPEYAECFQRGKFDKISIEISVALHALTHAHIPLEPPKPKVACPACGWNVPDAHQSRYCGVCGQDMIRAEITRLEQKGGEA